MNNIFTTQTVSVTELKREFAKVIESAQEDAVAILNRNKPEAYILSAEHYEWLLERMEDLEDAMLVKQREKGPFHKVNLEDI